MGTALTGTTPQDTYDSLIKVTDNGPLSATAKYLSDGLGNDSVLALSTARVGIGTVTPSYKLDVDVSTDADWAARIKNTSSTGYGLFVEGSENSGQYILGLYNGLAYKMVVTGEGNVGIGTTAPTSKLHIAAPDALSSWDSALPLVNVTNLDQTNGQGFALLARGGSLDANCNIFEVQDYSANSKFVVKGTGNVGIGTSSPITKLTLNNGGMGAGASMSSKNLSLNGGFIGGYTTGNIQSAVALYDGTAYGSDIGYFYDGTGYGITFSTNATISSSAPTERLRILSSGGITFNGDTAAANALDDYEEGTWTMGIQFGGASVGVTTSENTGTYTKIGRQVTVNGYLVLTSKGSSTGDARITGLPFTIANTNGNFSAPSFWLATVQFTNQFQGYATPNTTRIELWETTILGVSTTLTNADFANTSEIMVSLTYFV
jgi:hypothetical protein